jgi:hypothetical protein
MMDTVLLDLQYLPNITWFKHFLAAKDVCIERCENFVKSTARNRCIIAAVNGKQALSIPVIGGRDHHQLYTAVNISYVSNWQKNHWLSMQSAYGSTPFFEYYADKFLPFYDNQYESLFDYNLQLLQAVLKMLKVQKQFAFTEIYEKQPLDKLDLRSARKNDEVQNIPHYYQVFDNKNGFISNLSIIDLIFNTGPDALKYLMKP